MIFKEIRRHRKLSYQRHPLFERHRMARLIGWMTGAIWAVYLVILGSSLAVDFTDMVPTWEPYRIMNAFVLPVLLAIDFLLRFPLQQTPTQEVKPYLLLPVKRSRLISFLLLRSTFSPYNLFWLFLFVPFTYLTLYPDLGLKSSITYLLGMVLLFLINNHLHLLCRTLINESIGWILLPLLLYGGMGGLLIVCTKNSFPSPFFLLGAQFIEGHLYAFISAGILLILLIETNKYITGRLVYSEQAGSEDTSSSRHPSAYSFLERFGETGVYMQLELKMLLRCRSCKITLRSVLFLITVFAAAFRFSNIYSGRIMSVFICIYCFSAFSLTMLSKIMSYDGNYLDGLLTHKESVWSLLKAKYIFYSLTACIPLALMTPVILAGKLTVLSAATWFFYTIGAVHFELFQLAVYNKEALPLHAKLSQRQESSDIQIIAKLVVFGVPLLLYSALESVWGATQTNLVFLFIGLALTMASPWWLRNIYRRFMRQKYENLKGFRESRQR